MKNRIVYVTITVVLLVIEIIIEHFFKDGFVRCYLGDVFVTMLIYSFIKSIKNIYSIKLAIGVLVFSFVVESLQYIDVLTMMGITRNRFTDIVLGSTFSVLDLVCYTVGVISIFLIDYFFIEKS